MATKLSWLKKMKLQRDNILDQNVTRLLVRQVRGVKNLLYGEGRVVRWCFYAAILLNSRIGRKADSSELLHLPQETQNLDASEIQTNQSRVLISLKTCIMGLGGRERFKPSYKALDLDRRNLHGLCCLPPGYELAIIHP